MELFFCNLSSSLLKLTKFGIFALALFVLPVLTAPSFFCKSYQLVWLVETEPWEINYNYLLSSETITPLPLLTQKSEISFFHCN